MHVHIYNRVESGLNDLDYSYHFSPGSHGSMDQNVLNHWDVIFSNRAVKAFI